MNNSNYSVDRLLQLVRASYKEQKGELRKKEFFERLLGKLEAIKDPGVQKTSPTLHQHSLGQKYLYENAPYELRLAAHQTFFYLVRTGYICPKPTTDYQNFSWSEEWYFWTEGGLQWIEGAEPIPEAITEYMEFLREHVQPLDDVISQYILEALEAFNRKAYFAATVMLGAASEKAIYLLAASLLNVLKPSDWRNKFEEMLNSRKLFKLLEYVRKTIEYGSAGKSPQIPYSVSEGAGPHLASLFEAIRMQRNDAVHPMNAVVSASSVRLLLHSFPYALNVIENIRAWAGKNPKYLDGSSFDQMSSGKGKIS